MSVEQQNGDQISSLDNLSQQTQIEAEALLQTLQQLQLKEAKIEEQIKEKDLEVKVQTDRRERLKRLMAETADLQRRYNEANEFVTMARETVNTFPGDTQILRLERRVETLQGEVKEASHILKQKRTGVEAYQAKIKMLQTAKARLLEEIGSLVTDVKDSVKTELDVHDSVSNINPDTDVAVLSSICKERESELDVLNAQLEDRVKRDVDMTARLQQLQEDIAQTIPRIKQERDCDMEEIQIEWEAEKRQLLAIYGKLCVVNREQNYHLSRGTHIKRAAAKPVIDPAETKLSLNATELAKEINATRDKLKLNGDEVSEIQAALSQLKKEAAQELKEFNAAQAKGEEAVTAAQKSRNELQVEQNELRKLKTELMQLLQSLRENQTQLQRQAITVGNSSPTRAIRDRPEAT